MEEIVFPILNVYTHTLNKTKHINTPFNVTNELVLLRQNCLWRNEYDAYGLSILAVGGL